MVVLAIQRCYDAETPRTCIHTHMQIILTVAGTFQSSLWYDGSMRQRHTSQEPSVCMEHAAGAVHGSGRCSCGRTGAAPRTPACNLHREHMFRNPEESSARPHGHAVGSEPETLPVVSHVPAPSPMLTLHHCCALGQARTAVCLLTASAARGASSQQAGFQLQHRNELLFGHKGSGGFPPG